jgi:hypothetical protein
MTSRVSTQIYLASLQNALGAIAKTCNMQISADDAKRLDTHQSQLQALFRHSNVKTRNFTKMMTQISRPTDMKHNLIFHEIDAFHYVLRTFREKFSTVSFYGETTCIQSFTKCVYTVFLKLFNKSNLTFQLNSLYDSQKEVQDNAYYDTLDRENEKVEAEIDLSQFRGAMLDQARIAKEDAFDYAQKYALEQAEQVGKDWERHNEKSINNIKNALHFITQLGSEREAKANASAGRASATVGRARANATRSAFSQLSIEDDEEEEEDAEADAELEQVAVQVVGKLSFAQRVAQSQ